MSLLLEAMQRSRREQRQSDGQVPGLDAAAPAAQEAAPFSFVRSCAPVLVLIPVLLAGLLFWWLFPASTGEVGPTSTGMAGRIAVPDSTANPDEAATGLSEPEVEVVAAKPPAVPVDVPPDAPVDEGPVVALTAEGPGAEIVALYRKRDAPRAADPEPEVVAESAGDAPAMDIEAMVRQAEQALENQQVEEHSSPLLEGLAQSFKDALPTLMYLRHDYRSDAPGSVTINRREAGVGDTVAPGVTVVDILPDAVVLEYRGQSFRLRALNSWVNL